MTGLERIRRAVLFERVDHTPVAPLLGAHAAALAGLGHDRACRDAGVQAEALLHAVEAYEPDAIFTLMDLSAEPEALGAGVASEEGQPPVVVRHLTREDLETERLEQRILTSRVPVFIETVSRLRAALGDSVCIGALISGPLTATANAVGIADLARMLRRDREGITGLLDRLTDACVALQKSHAEAGAHAVVILEPVATTAILGPADLEALLLPRLQAVTEAARRLGLISILHVCGDCRRSLPLLARAGAHALSLDSPVEMTSAREIVGTRSALMGNLDVLRLLPYGRPEEVRRAVRDLIAPMQRGFILSSGCELPEQTPRANVAEMIAAARR